MIIKLDLKKKGFMLVCHFFLVIHNFHTVSWEVDQISQIVFHWIVFDFNRQNDPRFHSLCKITHEHMKSTNNSFSFPGGWRFPGGQRIWAILLNQNHILQEWDLISCHRIRVELLCLLNQSLTRSNMISEQSVCMCMCMCNCVFKWQCTSWVLIFPKGQARVAVREVEWWREGGRFKLPSEMFQWDA